MDLTWVKELSLADIHSILAIVELNDATITIPDGLIVANRKTLQMLDQTSLEVATATGFHCSINQTLKQHQKINHCRSMNSSSFYFTTSHAMEEELGWLDTGHESTIDESTCSGTGVERSKRGKRLPGNHQRWSFAFQLDLT
jgi:hypothetical protein